MGRVNDDSYFPIRGWMMTRLDLKPLELIVFAMIHNFTVNNQEYTGSYSYLIESLKISKPTAIKVLNDLVKKKYILEKKGNATTPNKYTINIKYIKKLTTPSKETLPQVVKKIDYPSKETLPNNNINNNKYNNKDNNINNITGEEEALGKVCELYAKEITGKLCCSPHEVKRLTELAEEHGIENLEKAINKAVEYNKKSLVYINGILSKNGSKAKKRAELPDEYDIPF